MTLSTDRFAKEIENIQQEGLYKTERIITTPQGAEIKTQQAGEVLNFCANNYLGLANHPEIIKSAIDALHTHGFGMASVRFICGTQDLHKELENSISNFLHPVSMPTPVCLKPCWVQKMPSSAMRSIMPQS